MTQNRPSDSASYSIFPKKLSYFALGITVAVILGQIVTLYKNIKEFERINTLEIPLLEMSAINVRLNQDIYNKINMAIVDVEHRQSHIDQIEAYTEALIFNMSEFLNKLNLNGNSKELYSREELHHIERKIYHVLRKGDIRAADKLYKSQKYQQLFSSFTEKMQEFTESIVIKRENIITQDKQNLVWISSFAVVVFVYIITLWLKVYNGYRKNLKVKEHLEHDLEEQRAFNFNSAKLASLGEMAAGIAHEINNPLTIISGSVFKLKRKMKKMDIHDEELEKSVDIISETTRRIANIVKSMRTISRDGTNDDSVMISLKEIVDEGIFLISEKIKLAQVDLIVEIDSESSDIFGKATQISQIIMNLVSNSIDAFKENEVANKVLKIKSSQTSDYIILSVTDNAGGIPSDVVDKIFNPFFTTKEVGKGTGLGLSLSKSIMENHGGELKLEQEDGMTIFLLYFPKTNSAVENDVA